MAKLLGDDEITSLFKAHANNDDETSEDCSSDHSDYMSSRSRYFSDMTQSMTALSDHRKNNDGNNEDDVIRARTLRFADEFGKRLTLKRTISALSNPTNHTDWEDILVLNLEAHIESFRDVNEIDAKESGLLRILVKTDREVWRQLVDGFSVKESEMSLFSKFLLDYKEARSNDKSISEELTTEEESTLDKIKSQIMEIDEPPPAPASPSESDMKEFEINQEDDDIGGDSLNFEENKTPSFRDKLKLMVLMEKMKQMENNRLTDSENIIGSDDLTVDRTDSYMAEIYGKNITHIPESVDSVDGQKQQVVLEEDFVQNEDENKFACIGLG